MGQLVYDTAVTDDDNDVVGAVLRAGATELTATGTALDVSIDNANIEVTQGTSPWVVGDGGGSLTVDAVDLDIRDLTAASDSVESWTHDGTGNAITSTGGALDVNIASAGQDTATANTAIVAAATSITTTATDIAATDLANRKYLHLANEGNKKAFLGGSGVTAAQGFPISSGEKQLYRAGPAIDMYAITAAGTADMRRLELS